MFHDLTVMKNFPVGAGGKKLQLARELLQLLQHGVRLRRSCSNDIDLHAAVTSCNARVDAPNGAGGTANVCDPTQGFRFTEPTLRNFGTVNLLRGHRVIELAVKFNF